LARKRKFDLWFWKYSDGSIIKEDELAVVEGVKIYNTLLLHRDNEYFNNILQAFKALNARDYDKYAFDELTPLSFKRISQKSPGPI
jgi:hypothetical protein